MREKILILTAFLYLANFSLAACPSADLGGDCFVDFHDFARIAAQWPDTDYDDVAEMANQWLTADPCVPEDMAYIPDGEFEMGDTLGELTQYSLPVHTVTVDWFYMGRYEITNGQYCDFLNWAGDNGWITVTWGNRVYQAGYGQSYPYCRTHSWDCDSQIDYNDATETFSVSTIPERDMSNDPVVVVSWHGAAAYCNWRSLQDGYEQCYDLATYDCDFSKKGYRLPTEAEWEYAARGGLAGRRFPWGNDIYHTQANYNSITSSSYDKGPTRGPHPLWFYWPRPYTSPVGFFDGTLKYKADYNWPGGGRGSTTYQTKSGANNYGLYDMVGNVWEWCNDRWGSHYYAYSPSDNPTGPMSGLLRVIRGGSWTNSGVNVAHRYLYAPTDGSDIQGFRIALDLN